MKELYLTEQEYNEFLTNVENIKTSLINYKTELKRFSFDYTFDIFTELKKLGEDNFRKILKSDIKVSLEYYKALNQEHYKNTYIHTNELDRHEIIEGAYTSFMQVFSKIVNEQPKVNTNYEFTINVYSLENTEFKNFVDGFSDFINTYSFYVSQITGSYSNNLEHSIQNDWQFFYDLNSKTLTDLGKAQVMNKISNDEKFYKLLRTEKIICAL